MALGGGGGGGGGGRLPMNVVTSIVDPTCEPMFVFPRNVSAVFYHPISFRTRINYQCFIYILLSFISFQKGVEI